MIPSKYGKRILILVKEEIKERSALMNWRYNWTVKKSGIKASQITGYDLDTHKAAAKGESFSHTYEKKHTYKYHYGMGRFIVVAYLN